jgi:FkbM family methyltransferase
MKSLISKIIGKKVYIRLEQYKKRWFPTKADLEQLKYADSQLGFYAKLIKPNDLCFDIGGNIGLKTNIFLRLNAKVVVLEPQQDCVDILSAKYGKRAIVLQKGAGESNEIKEFYLSNNSQLSSFNKNWISDLKNTRFTDSVINAVEKIEIITLDSLIEQYGDPDFIKIDVEGYELEVLKGLSKNFDTLSFEYAVPEKLSNVIECLQHLEGKYEQLVCNYSICNDMKFVFEQWVSVDIMLKHIMGSDFKNTFAGDIYVKQGSDR